MVLPVFIFSSVVLLTACSENPMEPPIEKEMKKEMHLVYSELSRPVLFFYSSTYCPGCGSWGSPVFKDLSAQYAHGIIPMGVHIKYGDPFITDESNALANNRVGQKYTPQLWVDNENIVLLRSGSIDGVASIEKAKEAFALKTEQKANYMVANAISIQNNKVFIKEGVKVNGKSDDAHFVATYILEDSLSYQQTGSAISPIKHNAVIRSSTQGAFGSKISSANQESEYVVPIKNEWVEKNLYAVTIVWIKNGENFEVVNATSTKINQQ
jgi:hypothetical protein